MVKGTTSLTRQMSTYQDALRLLAQRRRPVRPARSSKEEPCSLPAHYAAPDLRGTPSIVGMREWLRVLGHSDVDLKALNVIHVAGTKGKGSTCAFIESLLRAHGRTTGFPSKTGLYTSPHLVLPQERIRINFEPLSEVQLAKYFFEVYDTLERSREVQDLHRAPRYLQLWALVAFHTFIRERVDVAVVETHHGGEFDATNFIQQPVVTAITTLGMDHVDQLGPTLANIAWHKAGIFKSGAAAVSAPQVPEAAAVLQERAAEKAVDLEIAKMDSASHTVVARLPSEVLRMNCNVALTAANAYLRKLETSQQLSSADIAEGVAGFSWPGRFQQIQHGSIQWCLDAAHNELSMEKAAQWFAELSSKVGEPTKDNVLIFSHISSQRDGGNVLRSLLCNLTKHKALFDSVIFTTYVRADPNESDDQVSSEPSEKISSLWETYTKIWLEHYPDTKVYLQSTVDGAVSLAQDLEKEDIRVLATGSQHLLGGVLRLLPSGGTVHPE